MLLQNLFMPKAAPAAPAAVVAAVPPAGAAPASAAPVAPAAAPTAPATTAAAVAAAAQPVEDAGFAAKLLGKVGQSQNRFLANQQLVGEVSAVLGARLSQTLSNVMRLLKGEPTGEVTG